MSTRPIVLASASPQRVRLLEQLGVVCTAHAADIDETPGNGETAEALVERLAAAKAEAVALRFPDAVIIGSDTVVALDNAIFGKPHDEDNAARMLGRLAGCTHRVCSGVAITDSDRRASRLSVSHVTMTAIDPSAIAAYWASGEPRGKAGGYAIQGRGAMFVTHLAGSYSGVMGLPLYETAALLSAFGVDAL